MSDLMEGFSTVFNHYVRYDLGFKSDLLYRGPFGKAFHPEPLSADPETGCASDWMAMMFKLGAAGGDPPGSHPLRRAMLANPKLQVFSALGRYDGGTRKLTIMQHRI
jgi:hypothetical protein